MTGCRADQVGDSDCFCLARLGVTRFLRVGGNKTASSWLSTVNGNRERNRVQERRNE